jgi:hypothetical protein
VFQRNWQSGTRRRLNHSRGKPLFVNLYASISCGQIEPHRGVNLRSRRQPFLEQSSKWP